MTGLTEVSNAAAVNSRLTGRARGVLALVVAAGMLSGTSRTAAAQTSPEQKAGWEFLVSTGSVVPTGAQRDAIKRANLTAAQLSYVPIAGLAITTTVGWARSRDIATVGDPKLDVFTYDLGAEVRADRMNVTRDLTLRPFAGAGAGGRSYNYRSLDVDAAHNLAGYASVGGELGYRRVRLRVEARDYITGFKPLAGSGASDTRNDVVVMAGLRFIRR